MKFTSRRSLVTCLGLLLLAARPLGAATLDAVEYYNAALDHYFVTASANEIEKLDAGMFVGWQRTSYVFKAFDPSTPVSGASSVCRFYGRPAAGLDSHFYSASPAECAEVHQRFPDAWIEETENAFGVWLPNPQTGQCPATSVPVYRIWNKRIDSNHRFTTDPAVQQAMIARGYVAEGYGPGPMPVAMCAPSDGQPGPVLLPACVLSASNSTPNVGATVVLTATCTSEPTTFTWTGCVSSTATCSATSSAVGQVGYTVVARNAAGASAPASVNVSWQAATATAACTLSRTSQTDPPTVNTVVVLKATCNQTVSSFTWQGCSSTSSSCTVRELAPGAHTYSVFARNSNGASEPATMTLGWVSSPPSPPGLCSQFPSYVWSDVGSQSGRVDTAALINPPGFAWNGAWAVRFVVPSTIGSRLGNLSGGEFDGPPTIREATISRTPCDFRATDPSGANGPIARASGTSVRNLFTADPARPGYPVLQPGGTYYYNLRNWRPANGTISCSPSPGRCDAFVDTALPR